jgi:hypothetical protein
LYFAEKKTEPWRNGMTYTKTVVSDRFGFAFFFFLNNQDFALLLASETLQPETAKTLQE